MNKKFFIYTLFFLTFHVIGSFNPVYSQFIGHNKRLREMNRYFKYNNSNSKFYSKKTKAELFIRADLERPFDTSKKKYQLFNHNINQTDSLFSIPDTLTDSFRILSIYEKLYNYRISNDKLIEVKVYQIMIIPRSDSLLIYSPITIISESLILKTGEKIEVGCEFNLTVTPIFDKFIKKKYIGGPELVNYLRLNDLFIASLNVNKNYFICEDFIN